MLDYSYDLSLWLSSVEQTQLLGSFLVIGFEDDPGLDVFSAKLLKQNSDQSRPSAKASNNYFSSPETGVKVLAQLRWLAYRLIKQNYR